MSWREKDRECTSGDADSIFLIAHFAPHPFETKKKAAPASGRSNGQQQQETDPRRLEQRQKQIDFGKNTRGYQRYAAAVPR